MASRFTSFVVFREMRTGSNLLDANLNALPGVTSYGEVFNPHFIGTEEITELFGITLAERDRAPQRLLRKLVEQTQGLSGFRLFHDHDARVRDLVVADPACAKIILTRNPLESYVSRKIARATGQWKVTDPRGLKFAKAVFDAAEFRAHLDRLQAFQLWLLRALQVSGQTAFYLDYEDLAAVEVLNGLAAFLGVPGRLKAVDDTLKKQNPAPLADKLSNPEALATAAEGIDVFALSRTPNFEPRRAARPRFRWRWRQDRFCAVRSGRVRRRACATGWLALAPSPTGSSRNPCASGSAITPATAALPCCAIPSCARMWRSATASFPVGWRSIAAC